jgi:ketosteroid isomerase-like protein
MFPVIPALEQPAGGGGAMHFEQARRHKNIHTGLRVASRRAGTERTLLALATALLGCLPLFAGRPAAQKNQKEKKQEADTSPITSPIPPPDGQAIDTVVSQMLGAWQVGDVDMMHKAYADDVTVVSGSWEPPLLGWASYLKAYQAQRARTQSDRLERTNSYTKVNGNMAWCTYQWRYTGQVDGVQAAAFGHTTLVLEKRGGSWLIVLNHTSVVPVSTPEATPTAAPHNAQPTGQRTSGPGA